VVVSLVFMAVFIVSTHGTGVARSYALRKGLLDEPNHRTSHAVAKPRGGGIPFVICWIVLLLAFLGNTALTLALGGGGLGVALSGWLDDHGRASISVRLLLQFTAAIVLVSVVGQPVAGALGSSPAVALVLRATAVVGVVWLINSYNFMDGVDGIAATQAVVAGIGMGGVLLMAGSSDLAMVSFGLSVAALGFMRWNWSPAKVFMGDVGSGFLGFAFAALIMAGWVGRGGNLGLLLLPLGPFLADASATIAVRAIRGERIHAGHRRHLYQRLAQAGWSHGGISVVTGTLAALCSAFAVWGGSAEGRASPSIAPKVPA